MSTDCIAERMKRKLEAGEKLTREDFLALLQSMDDDERHYARQLIMAYIEMDESEQVAMGADLDAREGDRLGVVEMHRVMAKIKRNDPAQFAETATRFGWEGRLHG